MWGNLSNFGSLLVKTVSTTVEQPPSDFVNVGILCYVRYVRFFFSSFLKMLPLLQTADTVKGARDTVKGAVSKVAPSRTQVRSKTRSCRIEKTHRFSRIVVSTLKVPAMLKPLLQQMSYACGFHSFVDF